MISYYDAVKIIQQCTLTIESQLISTENSLHAIAAEDVVSKIMLPPFQSSNMDGFALNSAAATRHATELAPVSFHVLSTIAAGDDIESHTAKEDTYFNEPNIAYEVMTGAPVPASCDAVIPIEEVYLEYDLYNKISKITLNRNVMKSENIRFQGADFPLNQIILNKGDKITPEKIMLLSALGVASINVFKPIKIAVLSTGKEIIDDIEQPLQAGQIYNSNSPYLLAALQQFPTTVRKFKTVADDVPQFHQTMDEIESYAPNLIISTGAVSAGRWDFIPTALLERHAEIFFHKTAIKPGKPILFAKLNSETQGPYMFCLPGNPVSTMVGFHFFIEPYLRKSFCMPEQEKFNLILNTEGKKKKGMTFFLKAKASLNSQSQFCADILQGQESFKMKPLLEANGFVILDENVEEYTVGQKALFMPLRGIYDSY